MVPLSRISEILRFGIVGVMATVMHFAVLTLAVGHLHLPPTLSNGGAFLCAVGVTYLGQSLWVFRGHDGRSTAQILRFAASLALGFVANIAVMAIVTRGFGLDYRVGFLVGCVTVPVLSFFVNKLWVFRSASA